MQFLDLPVFFILVVETENIKINTEVTDTKLTQCTYIMYNILLRPPFFCYYTANY